MQAILILAIFVSATAANEFGIASNYQGSNDQQGQQTLSN